DFPVDHVVEPGQRFFRPPGEVHLDLAMLVFDPVLAPQDIQSAMLRGGDQPGSRIVRNPRLRPVLERREQSFLRQILGQAHIPHQPGEYRDHFGGLDAPNSLDALLDVAHRFHAAAATAIHSSKGTLATTSPMVSRSRSSARWKRIQAFPMSRRFPAALKPAFRRARSGGLAYTGIR